MDNKVNKPGSSGREEEQRASGMQKNSVGQYQKADQKANSPNEKLPGLSNNQSAKPNGSQNQKTQDGQYEETDHDAEDEVAEIEEDDSDEESQTQQTRNPQDIGASRNQQGMADRNKQ